MNIKKILTLFCVLLLLSFVACDDDDDDGSDSDEDDALDNCTVDVCDPVNGEECDESLDVCNENLCSRCAADIAALNESWSGRLNNCVSSNSCAEEEDSSEDFTDACYNWDYSSRNDNCIDWHMNCDCEYNCETEVENGEDWTDSTVIATYCEGFDDGVTGNGAETDDDTDKEPTVEPSTTTTDEYCGNEMHKASNTDLTQYYQDYFDDFWLDWYVCGYNSGEDSSTIDTDNVCKSQYGATFLGNYAICGSNTAGSGSTDTDVASTVCVDNDDGDYYIGSDLEIQDITTGDVQTRVSDICQNADTLQEMVCDGGSFKVESFDCPNGCDIANAQCNPDE